MRLPLQGVFNMGFSPLSWDRYQRESLLRGEQPNSWQPDGLNKFLEAGFGTGPGQGTGIWLPGL